MRRRSALSMPWNSRPRPTLSRTLRQGNRPNCWNTMAMDLRRTSRRVSALQLATSTKESPCRTRTSPRVTAFRPLAARKSVDLPEPDRPIRTEISPFLTVRFAPAEPSTTPVSVAMRARSAPPSKRARAFLIEGSREGARTRSPALGNRMSTFLNSTAVVASAPFCIRPPSGQYFPDRTGILE